MKKTLWGSRTVTFAAPLTFADPITETPPASIPPVVYIVGVAAFLLGALLVFLLK